MTQPKKRRGIVERKVMSLIISVLAVFLAVNVCLAEKVVFEDKFTIFDHGWGVPSDAAAVKDGAMVLSPKLNFSTSLLNQANFVPTDADISVTMTYLKTGDPAYGGGLIFWANGYDEYYSLIFNAEGICSIQRLIRGRWLTPVTWREFDAIKKGTNQPNLMRVVTKGNSATAYINGKELAIFSGQAPEGGQLVGIRCSSGPKGENEATFSGFKVTTP
jgi:hypothetical protein